MRQSNYPHLFMKSIDMWFNSYVNKKKKSDLFLPYQY